MHPSLDDTESQSVLVNDIVEGTMINLFWDPRRETWEIATKGSVAGNYWYYRTNYKQQDKKQLTFREMFCDAISAERATTFKSFTMFDHLKKDYCYSFVLQHPENHIVCTVPFATLYLVSCYKINGKNVSYMNPNEELCEMDNEKFFLSVIRKGDYDSLEDFLKSNDHTSSALSLGFMFTDTTTGLRSKILNKNYEFLKEIRGNNPNMQFHFFALQRANKMKEFWNTFLCIRTCSINFTINAVNLLEEFMMHMYCIMFKRKEKKLKFQKIFSIIFTSFILMFIYLHYKKVKR